MNSVHFSFQEPLMYPLAQNERENLDHLMTDKHFPVNDGIDEPSIGLRLIRRMQLDEDAHFPAKVLESRTSELAGYFRQPIWHTDNFKVGSHIVTFSNGTPTLFATMEVDIDGYTLPRGGEFTFLRHRIRESCDGNVTARALAHEFTEEVMSERFRERWVSDWEMLNMEGSVEGITISDIHIRQLLPYVVAVARQENFLHTADYRRPGSPKQRIFGRYITDLQVSDLSEGHSVENSAMHVHHGGGRDDELTVAVIDSVDGV